MGASWAPLGASWSVNCWSCGFDVGPCVLGFDVGLCVLTFGICVYALNCWTVCLLSIRLFFIYCTSCDYRTLFKHYTLSLSYVVCLKLFDFGVLSLVCGYYIFIFVCFYWSLYVFNYEVLWFTQCTCGCLITMQLLFLCFTQGDHTMSSCLTQIPACFANPSSKTCFCHQRWGGIYVENHKGFQPILLVKGSRPIPLEIAWWLSVVWASSPTKMQHELAACHQIWGWVFILKILIINGAQGKYPHILSKRHICFLANFTMSPCLKQQLMLLFLQSSCNTNMFTFLLTKDVAGYWYWKPLGCST